MSIRDCIFTGLLVTLCGAALYLLLPAYTEHRHAAEALSELRRNLAAQELEIQKLRLEMSALRTDYRAVERVAREKFGWCRDNEKVYHFDATATPDVSPK
jgi:cell division protein FtsB